MRIAVASDHAGFHHKERIQFLLEELGHEVIDFGTDSDERCDYPDTIHPAAAAVSSGDCERGVIFGGSGNGEAIVANRHPGVRCGLCWNVESARLTRQHNDANMISIGERMVDEKLAVEIVLIFLETAFEGGRHVARIAKIDRE